MLRVVSFGFTCSRETQTRTRHTIYIEDADQAVSRLRQNGRNGESGDRVKVAVPGPWVFALDSGLSYNKSSGAAGSRHPTRGLKHCRLDC
jgi:hypothetical protein